MVHFKNMVSVSGYENLSSQVVFMSQSNLCNAKQILLVTQIPNLYEEKQSVSFIQINIWNIIMKLHTSNLYSVGPLSLNQVWQKHKQKLGDDIASDSQRLPQTVNLSSLCFVDSDMSAQGPYFFKQFRVRNHSPPFSESHIFGPPFQHKSQHFNCFLIPIKLFGSFRIQQSFTALDLRECRPCD